MSVFQVWLGMALTLAEFAALPHHSEGERVVLCALTCCVPGSVLINIIGVSSSFNVCNLGPLS